MVGKEDLWNEYLLESCPRLNPHPLPFSCEALSYKQAQMENNNLLLIMALTLSHCWELW